MKASKILYVADSPETPFEKERIEKAYGVEIVSFYRVLTDKIPESELVGIIDAVLKNKKISGIYFSVGEKNEFYDLTER